MSTIRPDEKLIAYKLAKKVLGRLRSHAKAEIKKEEQRMIKAEKKVTVEVKPNVGGYPTIAVTVQNTEDKENVVTRSTEVPAKGDIEMDINSMLRDIGQENPYCQVQNTAGVRDAIIKAVEKARKANKALAPTEVKIPGQKIAGLKGLVPRKATA